MQLTSKSKSNVKPVGIMIFGWLSRDLKDLSVFGLAFKSSFCLWQSKVRVDKPTYFL